MIRVADAKKPRRRNRRGEGERLRVEIIEAAIRVLERIGDDDSFSLRAVAKEAKIAAPSVYLHFRDRSVLILAVLEQLFAEQATLRDAAEAEAAKIGGGAWERLLARSLSYIQFGLEHTGHYKVLYEGRAIPRLDDPTVAAFGQSMYRRTVELIREIQATKPGRKAADPERLALLLWAGLHGLVSLRVNKPVIDWPDTAELAEQMMRALIRPSSEPLP